MSESSTAPSSSDDAAAAVDAPAAPAKESFVIPILDPAEVAASRDDTAADEATAATDAAATDEGPATPEPPPLTPPLPSAADSEQGHSPSGRGAQSGPPVRVLAAAGLGAALLVVLRRLLR